MAPEVLPTESKRISAGDWPELETALFEWHQRIDEKKAVITGDILKEQASKFCGQLLQYTGKAEPKWPNGWLGGFKARFKIKEYITYGEVPKQYYSTNSRPPQVM